MTKVKITEPITKQDYQSIIDLIEENIIKYVTTLKWLQSFAFGDIKIAKIDDKVVGAIVMTRNGKAFDDHDQKYFDVENIKCQKNKYGHITFIVVDKNFHGMGIGKKLVKAGIKYLKETGSSAIGVHCWQSSPGNASEKLFRSLEFEALKMHIAPWLEDSLKKGPKKSWCVACGYPCKCDELEMILYL